MDKKQRVALSVFGILMLILGLFIGLSVANPSSPIFVIEQNSMNVCASFIIGRRDATTSYVRNATGEISYTNTSDKYTFAKARDYCSSDGGGLIFVRAGWYDFGGGGISGRAKVCWQGEGWATVIGDGSWQLNSSSYISHMRLESTYMSCASDAVENVTISHCHFRGDYLWLKGYLMNVHHCVFTGNSKVVVQEFVDSINIHDCTFDSALIECNLNNNATNIKITDNIFNGSFASPPIDMQLSAQKQIYNIDISRNSFGSSSPAQSTIRCTLGWVSGTNNYRQLSFCNNQIYGGKMGIYLTTFSGSPHERSNTAYNVLIANNQIRGCTGDGIKLTGDTNVGYSRWRNITISNNKIYSCGNYGVNITNSDVYSTSIKRNEFYGNTNGAISNNGTDTIIADNEGFVTENSGLTTIANDEYVSHGLASSLNIGPSNSTVLVTPYTTVYDDEPVSVGCKAVNGTHIQFSAYWTNGTAITADAIQVWYRVTWP